MIVFSIFGRLFVLLALAVLAFGIYLWLVGYDVTMQGGLLWFQIDAPSLNTLQALVQRFINPGLWDEVVVDILLRPAWESLLGAVIFFLLLGGVFLWVGGRRNRRRSFR